MNIEIRKIKASDWPAFEIYKQDWARDRSPFKNRQVKEYQKITAENFADWILKMQREEMVVDDPDSSTYDRYFALVDEDHFAGVVSCRWQIEKGDLRQTAGHIGYAVAPSFRGHHLAEKLLRFALEKYKQRGIYHVMISADEENLASRKTIEKCAGKLEEMLEFDGHRLCHYWIKLS